MLIKNGWILSPGDQNEFHGDLRIMDGKVTETGTLSPLDHEEVIDASSCIVAPGLMDVHVHFRDPVSLTRKICIQVHYLRLPVDLPLLSAWQIPDR